MTSSGTYQFNLSNADLLLESFDRVGMRPTMLTREHLISGYRSLNLALQNLSNQVPNLWEIDLVQVPIVDGQSVYSVDPSTMCILDVYLRFVPEPQPTDRILLPLGRTDYAMIPNKEIPGPPTSFWFDRLLAPTITIWPVPNPGTETWELHYYRMKRIQDSNASMGQTPDIPNRYLEAICAMTAAKLAEKFAPDREDKLIAKATARLMEAQTEDRERAPIYITPDLSAYYRIG